MGCIQLTFSRISLQKARPHYEPRNQAIEDYVEEFCALCHQVGFNDIGIFHKGLTAADTELGPELELYAIVVPCLVVSVLQSSVF